MYSITKTLLIVSFIIQTFTIPIYIQDQPLQEQDLLPEQPLYETDIPYYQNSKYAVGGDAFENLNNKPAAGATTKTVPKKYIDTTTATKTLPSTTLKLTNVSAEPKETKSLPSTTTKVLPNITKTVATDAADNSSKSIPNVDNNGPTTKSLKTLPCRIGIEVGPSKTNSPSLEDSSKSLPVTKTIPSEAKTLPTETKSLPCDGDSSNCNGTKSPPDTKSPPCEGGNCNGTKSPPDTKSPPCDGDSGSCGGSTKTIPSKTLPEQTTKSIPTTKTIPPSAKTTPATKDIPSGTTKEVPSPKEIPSSTTKEVPSPKEIPSSTTKEVPSPKEIPSSTTKEVPPPKEVPSTTKQPPAPKEVPDDLPISGTKTIPVIIDDEGNNSDSSNNDSLPPKAPPSSDIAGADTLPPKDLPEDYSEGEDVGADVAAGDVDDIPNSSDLEDDIPNSSDIEINNSETDTSNVQVNVDNDEDVVDVADVAGNDVTNESDFEDTGANNESDNEVDDADIAGNDVSPPPKSPPPSPPSPPSAPPKSLPENDDVNVAPVEDESHVEVDISGVDVNDQNDFNENSDDDDEISGDFTLPAKNTDSKPDTPSAPNAPKSLPNSPPTGPSSTPDTKAPPSIGPSSNLPGTNPSQGFDDGVKINIDIPLLNNISVGLGGNSGAGVGGPSVSPVGSDNQDSNNDFDTPKTNNPIQAPDLKKEGDMTQSDYEQYKDDINKKIGA